MNVRGKSVFSRNAQGICVVLAAAIVATTVGCDVQKVHTAHPEALADTQPPPVNEVQDAAIWIHPTEPAKSLFLVANERRGLEVHSPDGLLLKHLQEGSEPRYVDVLYDVPTGDASADLVVTACQGEGMAGVRLYRVDPAKSKLAIFTDASLPVFNGTAPLGIFAWHDRKGKTSYVFVTDELGNAEQYRLAVEGGDTGKLELLRSIKLPGKAKCGVVDPDSGKAYFAVDKQGVWAIDATPGAPVEGKFVIRTGENGLVPNVRGPALLRAADGHNRLVVSGQATKGSATRVNVYDATTYAFLAAIEPAPGALGVPEHASGIDVTSHPLGPAMPAGALLINDQINPNGSESFKIYDWGAIAREARLSLDKPASPRS